jgi:hypothetical protein
VVWKQLVGVQANGNSLTKTTVTGKDAGAVSSQRIDAKATAGYVEWTASETTTYRMVGLSNGNSGPSSADVDFGINLTPDGGGHFYVVEKGVSRGDFGAYATGDVFRVAVAGKVVRYSRNGVVFYESTQEPKYPLLVDTWLYTHNATIINALVSSVRTVKRLR